MDMRAANTLSTQELLLTKNDAFSTVSQILSTNMFALNPEKIL
jgi:hypothetical protein